jgi:hypothetical protein
MMGAKAALFICTNALVAGGQINVDTLAAVVKNQVALIPGNRDVRRLSTLSFFFFLSLGRHSWQCPPFLLLIAIFHLPKSHFSHPGEARVKELPQQRALKMSASR